MGCRLLLLSADWGGALHMVFAFPAGCMLCLGQSTFLRFNHPAEAKWMKSMIPTGGRVPGTSYGSSPGRSSWPMPAITRIPTGQCPGSGCCAPATMGH